MSRDAKTRIAILLVISMLLSGCTGEVLEEPIGDVPGCMDETASNYNPDATENKGHDRKSDYKACAKRSRRRGPGPPTSIPAVCTGMGGSLGRNRLFSMVVVKRYQRGE